MIVSIIGGSGFIGTRLCDRLSKHNIHNVQIFDKNPSKAYPDLVKIGDVRSMDSLRKSIPERSIIVNLAAEHRDDVRPVTLYDDVNVGGAHNICKVANEKGVNTIVFTSTVAVYGFAPIGTDENGRIAPFNHYGRTKYEAEEIFRSWQREAPKERALIIIRPTVVFGERNRGNVYNLLSQIASGRFVMVGNGNNRKSMAYVENIAAFIEAAMHFKPGVHIYNYVDKPDFTMNELVRTVKGMLGKKDEIGVRLPYSLGYIVGLGFDILSRVTGKNYTISSIRVKKFCADSVYNTAIENTGFVPPVPMVDALNRTIRYEFIEPSNDGVVYYTE